MARFLTGDASIDDYLSDVVGRATEYAGFNLLLGNSHELWHFNARTSEPVMLESGVYGLSNAGLDTPWPKLLKMRAALEDQLQDPRPQRLLALLGDEQQAEEAELPQTGVGLATERLLSSVFIASQNYGTRASTVLIVEADGSRLMVERSFGPFGGQLGEVTLQV